MFVVLDAIWRPFFYLLFNQTLYYYRNNQSLCLILVIQIPS